MEDHGAVGQDTVFIGTVDAIEGDTLWFVEGARSGPDGVIMGGGFRPDFRVRRGVRREFGRGARFGGIGGGLLLGSIRLIQGPDDISDPGTPATAGEKAFQGFIVGTALGAVAGPVVGLAFHGPNWVDVRGVGPPPSGDSNPRPEVVIQLRMSVPRAEGSQGARAVDEDARAHLEEVRTRRVTRGHLCWPAPGGLGSLAVPLPTWRPGSPHR